MNQPKTHYGDVARWFEGFTEDDAWAYFEDNETSYHAYLADCIGLTLRQAQFAGVDFDALATFVETYAEHRHNGYASPVKWIAMHEADQAYMQHVDKVERMRMYG